MNSENQFPKVRTFSFKSRFWFAFGGLIAVPWLCLVSYGIFEEAFASSLMTHTDHRALFWDYKVLDYVQSLTSEAFFLAAVFGFGLAGVLLSGLTVRPSWLMNAASGIGCWAIICYWVKVSPFFGEMPERSFRFDFFQEQFFTGPGHLGSIFDVGTHEEKLAELRSAGIPEVEIWETQTARDERFIDARFEYMTLGVFKSMLAFFVCFLPVVMVSSLPDSRVRQLGLERPFETVMCFNFPLVIGLIFWFGKAPPLLPAFLAVGVPLLIALGFPLFFTLKGYAPKSSRDRCGEDG